MEAGPIQQSRDRPTSATTASSSTGLKVQVEYTTRPPTFTIWQACRAMRTCSGCSPLPLPAGGTGECCWAHRTWDRLTAWERNTAYSV